MGGSRGQLNGDVHPAAAAGFDANAGDYERARPGYPDEVAAVLARELRLGRGARVCDLAAGTGKLTRLLLRHGFDVVAVEPVEGMRREFAAVLPDVEIRAGTAEAIPLPDASVDAVTVGQAFHWFRFAEALAEIRRVVRPGGGVALVWNARDDAVPWVRGMSEVLDWHNRTVSSYQRTDWHAVLTDNGFLDVGHHTIRWEQPLTREVLAARVRSISYVGAMDAAGQQDHVDRVLALVEDQPDEFPLPYTTLIWWGSTP